MSNAPLNFIVLDPRKGKRRAVADALSPLGSIRWLRMVPISLGWQRRAGDVADEAMTMSKARGHSTVRRRLTRDLLKGQYAGTRKRFEKTPDAVAVCWNGLNGSRRVFMQAAKDAGARTLFFELAPLPGRITIDPAGVNFENALPRRMTPYLDWAAQARRATGTWRQLRDAIAQRPSDRARAPARNLPPLEAPFVFVALQTPGDSQLRLFGGAFPTVESFVEACNNAARHLPDGWHMRIKEHPTAPTDLAAMFAAQGAAAVYLDNDTDTFAQVAASRAVITVNSSVGVQAMLFEKPVVACGRAFWAIDGIAEHAPDAAALAEVCARADTLRVDTAARNAFLDYLDQVYYPDPEAAPALVAARLAGADKFGFWDVQLQGKST